MKRILHFLAIMASVSALNAFAADQPAIGAATNKPAAKAQKPKVEHKTYLTPAEAGPDFVDQGEYVGSWGGAQVIALGESRFRAVLYKGGLPGAGWDKSPKVQFDGKRDGDAVVFSPPTGVKGKLGGGLFAVTLVSGEDVAFKKAERTSPTIGAKPPAGAIALFDGSNADRWAGGHTDARNLLQAGTKTKEKFTNFTLHAEFLLPFKPTARGQDRANSGVYLQDRYEVQVLDSFGLNGEDNECGGIYTVARPLVNMCLPPLQWQTYDIQFKAAQFDDAGRKVKNATTTLKHNGVVIQDNTAIPGPTGGGAPEKPTGGAIQLQGHGNPVFFRNVWIVAE